MNVVPRVAIAMAVYNDERYLELTLRALAAQTFRDFHLTIFDDGSSDGSAAVAEAFAARFPARVIRGVHLGRHRAKQSAWTHAADAPLLMVLDSDIALPPDALARMVAAIDADPRIAAVSGRYRSDPSRPYGPSQAFIDDVFFESNLQPSGDCRWIVGGCVLFRRSALEGIEIGEDLGEDHHLSEKLRKEWRLTMPPGLVATHFGVPVTLMGVLRRFDREAVRIRALLRTYPEAWQVGSVARLVPLPLCCAVVAGAVLRNAALAAVPALLLIGYVAAFLIASRRVRSTLAARIGGALLFTIGNLGFGLGFLRESIRGRSSRMREPARTF